MDWAKIFQGSVGFSDETKFAETTIGAGVELNIAPGGPVSVYFGRSRPLRPFVMVDGSLFQEQRMAATGSEPGHPA